MHKILIPVDGSDSSFKTIEWALNTFDKATTSYYLFHVIKVLPDIPNEAYEVEEAIQILNKGRELVESKGGTVISSEYMVGEPGDMICHFADEKQVDEVLIGSHGRSGLTKLLLGSVSTDVLEHCSRPVFVYRNVERKPSREHGKSKIMISA